MTLSRHGVLERNVQHLRDRREVTCARRSVSFGNGSWASAWADSRCGAGAHFPAENARGGLAAFMGIFRGCPTKVPTAGQLAPLQPHAALPDDGIPTNQTCGVGRWIGPGIIVSPCRMHGPCLANTGPVAVHPSACGGCELRAPPLLDSALWEFFSAASLVQFLQHSQSSSPPTQGCQ